MVSGKKLPAQTIYKHFLLYIIIIPFYILGIYQDLPYAPKSDEFSFVKPAVNIVSTRDLNPHKFGQPGSTLIYPLAFIYHIENTLFHDGQLLHANPGIQTRFNNNPELFYIQGRILNILYALLSLPFIFLISSRFLGRKISYLLVFLVFISPNIIDHAQTVRTDSSALFFGAMSVWLILKTKENPSIRNQLLTGISIGLSIASRYFLVVIVPLLLLTDIYILHSKHLYTNSLRKYLLTGFIIGITAIFAAFFTTTPYILLDFPTSLTTIRHEARTSHLGADNLSQLGNFFWYLTIAIPNSISWPLTILAYLGFFQLIISRRFDKVIFASFTIMFLTAISLLSLHWEYWLVPVIPFIFIAAFAGFSYVSKFLFTRYKIKAVSIASGIFLVLSISPYIYQSTIYNLGKAGTTTRIQAREWITKNLPPKSKIIQEQYSASLENTTFSYDEYFSLAEKFSSEKIKNLNTEYIITSSYIYERYFHEPNRYINEINFYQNIDTNSYLVKQIKPALIHSGPTINIYKIR